MLNAILVIDLFNDVTSLLGGPEVITKAPENKGNLSLFVLKAPGPYVVGELGPSFVVGRLVLL